MKKKVQKRAVRDDDKIAKKAHIINVAARLLEKKDPRNFTMDEVSELAKVAKGTLYLYFKTKEELCLYVLIDDIHLFMSDLKIYFQQGKKKKPADFASYIAEYNKSHLRLLKLTAMMPLIFERNLDKEAIRNFEKVSREVQEQMVEVLVSSSLCRNEDQATIFIMQITALLRGLWSYGFPSDLQDLQRSFAVFDYFEILKYSLIQILTAPDVPCPKQLRIVIT